MIHKNFFENGFEVVGFPELEDPLNSLRKKIFSVFNEISGSVGLKVSNDDELSSFRLTHQRLQHHAFKHLYNLPELFFIGGLPIFEKFLTKNLGFIEPTLELPPHLRCDIPIAGQSLFKQHQDYSYNLGSENSVTIWIPLQNTDIEHGALYVAPGTHKDGVYPNHEGVISEKYMFDFIPCPVPFGHALVFNQKLVHKSGFNKSNQVRFSIQLRFTDLGCRQYAEAGYPLNHKITTEKYAEQSLLKTIRGTLRA
jgi:ectoine hydroxylase-related dioxygenase (phytanoyl-CoA dioxygenase family)